VHHLGDVSGCEVNDLAGADLRNDMAIDQPSVLACGYRSLLQIRMLSQITLRKLANGGSPPMIGSSTRWIATLNNFRLGLVGQSSCLVDRDRPISS
jgi:hypothetical protein